MESQGTGSQPQITPRNFSFLDLVNFTDNTPYPEDPQYDLLKASQYTFLSHDLVPIGSMSLNVLSLLQASLGDYSSFFVINESKQTIALHPSLTSFEKRNEAMSKVASTLLQSGSFQAVLSGWRNELYVVYCPSTVPYLLIERAASPLFGVVTYGVHITGYVSSPSPKTPGKIWVPRRSYTKPTFPGMLDNTVAGGLGYPFGILETAVKECGEEAGLNETYVRNKLRPAGVISYWYQHKYDNTFKLSQPEVEYVYDLEIPSNVIPHPVDGEVAEFKLMTIDDICRELLAGNFKPNAALVMIDFFIRHGIITALNNSSYLEILQRLHRRFPYPIQ